MLTLIFLNKVIDDFIYSSFISGYFVLILLSNIIESFGASLFETLQYLVKRLKIFMHTFFLSFGFVISFATLRF